MNLHDREESVALVKAALSAAPMRLVWGSLQKADDQPRDEKGQWTSEGGGGSGSSDSKSSGSGKIPTSGADRMYVEASSSNAGGGARSEVPKAIANLHEQVKDDKDGGAAKLKAGLTRMTDKQVISLSQQSEGLTGAGKYKDFADALNSAVRSEYNSRAMNSKDFQAAVKEAKK